MAKKKDIEAEIKRGCWDSALKLMFKYGEPTPEQTYHFLCTQDHCPTEHCTYMFGFKEGRMCDHVFRVKRIISNILSIKGNE
jgi:hypothetical protein